MSSDGRLDDISVACDEVISMAGNNIVLIIYAGIKNFMDTFSEELLEKFRPMIKGRLIL